MCLRKDVQNSCLQCAGGPEGRLASKATEMSAPCSAQRRPAPPSALRRSDPTRPLCVRVLDSTGLLLLKCFLFVVGCCRAADQAFCFLPTCPACMGFTETIKRRSTCQHSRTGRPPRRADTTSRQPLVNRWSIAHHVPPNA